MKPRLSFRALIFGGCLLVVACTLLGVALAVEGRLRQQTTDSLRSTLRQMTILAGELVEDRWSPQASPARNQELAQELGQLLSLRFTLIAVDGRVLGDSSLSLAEVGNLENHGRRPEVVQALTSGAGDQIRYSSTIHDDLVYAAMAVDPGQGPRVLARLAMPLSSVQSAVATSRGVLLGAMVLGILLSLAVAYVVARGLDKPVRALAATARAIAAGDLGQRIRRYPPHEVGDLARTFDKMADSLVHQMEAMAHAHDRQEAILRGMVEGVMLTDFEGRILLANQSLVSLLGLQTDPVGRIYSEVLRIPDLTSAMEDILEGQPRVSAEIRSLGPPLRYLEAHLVRLEGRGPQAGAVAVFHDITERRHIDQMRRDFVANTSHELRTPLAAIKGAAETLLDGALDSPQHARGFVEMIVRQSRRMERLGEDLLSLASLENAEVAPKREAVKARQVVAAVLATAGPLAQQRGIHLEAQEPPQDYSLMADGRQLEQALLNLVDNAIKYNNPGGKVTIALNALEGQLRLSVRDTGPGIPSEHLPRIFERFYRVDKNRSREQGGTGLGLAIVKHVAQAHGGRVEVESKVGRGSEFRLILPLKSGERSYT